MGLQEPIRNAGNAQGPERPALRTRGHRTSCGLRCVVTGAVVVVLLIAMDHLSVYTGQRQQTGPIEYDILGGVAAAMLFYIYSRGE